MHEACGDVGKVGAAGRQCRRSPFLFSFVPRCWGECGSQKYTATSVAALELTCAAISLPLPHVTGQCRCAGSPTIFYATACRTVCAEWSVGRGASCVNRVVRSTIAATWDFPPRPRIRLPSQRPKIARSATSVGRSTAVEYLGRNSGTAAAIEYAPFRKPRCHCIRGTHP